jgi:hypothetical protein
MDLSEIWSNAPINISGLHTDYTISWYKDVGKTIINAMIVNMIFPVIEYLLFLSIRYFRRTKYTCCRNKVKSEREYIKLFSGPEYFLHTKYSYVLNIVFITFMFGAGMPILFPIACLSFCIFYILERITLAYSCQAPPMFDEKLNSSAIKFILFAPFLFLTFGFWMISNIQLFHNQVIYNKTFN